MRILIKVLFVLELLGYLFSYVVGTNVPLIGILSIYIGVLLIYFFVEKRYIPVNNEAIKITVGIILIFSIYSLLVRNSDYTDLIVTNSIKSLVFIINIYFTSAFIYSEKEKNFFLKSAYLTISIFLVCCYILHFDNFKGIASIGLVFNNTERYRSSYGLYHYNATGYLCLLSLILWKFVKYSYNYKNKFKYYIINSLVIIILISTASRNSIICVALFYFGVYILKKNYKLNTSAHLRISKRLALISVGIIFFVLIFNFVNIQKIIANTNRLDNYTVNISILLDTGRVLTGIGFIDEKLFVYHMLPYATTFIDSWFLYVFLTLGAIGLFSSIACIIYLFSKIFYDKSHSKYEKVMVLMFLCTNLFHSMFESFFFAPGTILSYISWNVYFIFLFERVNLKRVHKEE